MFAKITGKSRFQIFVVKMFLLYGGLNKKWFGGCSIYYYRLSSQLYKTKYKADYTFSFAA
ncbi:MAG: hypothetical protein IPL08_17355 [Saprospiraceae bacterium]|nr:hypothetical protein [Saprospiraceae bacterium]